MYIDMYSNKKEDINLIIDIHEYMYIIMYSNKKDDINLITDLCVFIVNLVYFYNNKNMRYF